MSGCLGEGGVSSRGTMTMREFTRFWLEAYHNIGAWEGIADGRKSGVQVRMQKRVFMCTPGGRGVHTSMICVPL